MIVKWVIRMPDLKLEKDIIKQSEKQVCLVAGCDEAGRGAFAGPLVAAAVILPIDVQLPHITDSKKISKKKHIEYANQIMKVALGIGIGIVDVDYIDRFGVGVANKKALEDAIKDLPVQPNHVLIDGANQQVISTTIPQTQVISGDSISLSIASASIIAKSVHDALMKKGHIDYPEYGWETNTGYGTQEHISAIYEFGISPYHRKSLKPIQKYLQQQKLKGGML